MNNFLEAGIKPWKLNLLWPPASGGTQGGQLCWGGDPASCRYRARPSLKTLPSILRFWCLWSFSFCWKHRLNKNDIRIGIGSLSLLEEEAQALDLKMSFSSEYYRTQITNSSLFDVKNANMNSVPLLKKKTHGNIVLDEVICL